jgi:hypothetical protein
MFDLNSTEKINYIDLYGRYSALKWMDYLKMIYSVMDGRLKPISALYLKHAILTDETNSIHSGKLSVLDVSSYYSILKNADAKYGDVDKHLADCIGKNIAYTLFNDQGGEGKITEFIDHSCSYWNQERKQTIIKIGFKIQTATEEKLLWLDEMFVMVLK